MDINEASLIRVEEQLKESARNQTSIILDLKEIFNRLERESKSSVILSGDLKSHLESSKYRWDSLAERLERVDDSLKDLAFRVNVEKEERAKFEQDIKASVRTIKWVFGTLASIASVLSAIVGIAQFAR